MCGDMGKLEKVIKALENCNAPEKCRDCPWKPCEEHDCKHSDYPDGLIEQAIALLKEQEPVKPVMDIDTWKCGNCGHTLEYQELLGDNVLFYEQYNYCPGCGRSVKWE